MVNQSPCHFEDEPSKKIGSFRDGGTSCEGYIQQLFLECDGDPLLGKEIFESLFMCNGEHLSDGLDMDSLMSYDTLSDNPIALLNHGAFGRAYNACITLSDQLRIFARKYPDLFYDQLMIPLLKHSYQTCADFFHLKNPNNVVLLPNCTMGMKAVMDKILMTTSSSTYYGKKMKQLGDIDTVHVAYLSPIYGATQNLIRSYLEDVPSRIKVTEIVPENALFQEDPNIILKAIDDAQRENCPSFSVLICDEIASQSGRILPLAKIAEFCERKNIILIVDGTQSFDFSELKMEKIDYWVMSTHKWIANVKTCGVVLWNDTVDCPKPPAVSFGYFNENIQDKFLWTGMMDTYISYIVLAKALDMKRHYGEQQIEHASDLLRKGLHDVLQVKPLLESKGIPHLERRLINTFELKNIDSYWKCLVWGDKAKEKSMVTANDVQNVLERVFGIHVAVKDFRVGNGSCNLQTERNELQKEVSKGTRSFHVRVSAFSYNTISDFERLHNVLYNNISLTDHIKRNKFGLLKWNIKMDEALRPRLSKLQQVVRKHFLLSFERYETLFDAVKPKALFIRAEKLRHHLIFYFGHTAVFYVNKLIAGGYLSSNDRIDPHFESVFAIGVDEMTWDDTLTENYDWCGFLDDLQKLEEYYGRVKNYRQKVKYLILKLIENNDIQLPNNASGKAQNNEWVANTPSKKNIVIADKIPLDSIYWIFLMGIEHENIHLETSCSIISGVPLQYIKEVHNWDFNLYPYDTKDERIMNMACSKTLEKVLTYGGDDIRDVQAFDPITNFNGDNPAPPPLPRKLLHNRLLPVKGGTVKLGKENVEQDIYGWDNEFGSESHILDDFEVSETLVSNAEFLLFMKKGNGYQDSRWWSKEGWKYVNDMNVTMPRLWRKENTSDTSMAINGETYYYRTLLKEIPLQWSWPVEINNLEAQAFCKWKSFVMQKPIRLLSHEEQFLIRQRTTCNTANTNLHTYGSPSSVYHHNGYLDGGIKIFDIYGNVWRHSVSVLTVLKGFKTHPVYEDFTLPTLDGKHNHILGGSWVSLGNCANLNARIGFRRHFQQYAGIRYVSSPNNNYHQASLPIFDNIMLGKQITEHYNVFKNESLPLVMTHVPTVRNWPAKLGELAASKINAFASRKNDKCKEQMEGEGHLDSNSSPLRVLIAYAGAGRITLELLRRCSNLTIDHTDPTANTLQVLDNLLKTGKLQWYQQIEGDINELFEYTLHGDEDSRALLDNKKNNVSFIQLFDYTNINSTFDNYDVVVADIRFCNAQKQISHISERLKKDGILILGTIDDLHSSKDEDDKNHRDSLIGYEPLDRTISVPHMYRETINKNQFSVSHFSCWKKCDVQGDKDGVDKKSSMDAGASTNHSVATSSYYEDKSILDSYEKFHFGAGEIGVRNFPLAIAEFCSEMALEYGCKLGMAMEAGCGPGRTAFELCKTFDKVEAFDYSQNFIDSLNKHKYQHLKTPELLQKITAYQGDAHKMKMNARLPEFDLILGCNLIDRLHSPEVWIRQTKEMSKGLVIICSPYTWKDIHTPREKWVGGKYVNGEKYFTVDGLKDLMAPEFTMVQQRKIVFSIADSDGTFQYTASNCTVFAKV